MGRLFNERYEVVVVGAGHAGCEAAMATARMGLKTALVTLNLDLIAPNVVPPGRRRHSQGPLGPRKGWPATFPGGPRELEAAPALDQAPMR